MITGVVIGTERTDMSATVIVTLLVAIARGHPIVEKMVGTRIDGMMIDVAPLPRAVMTDAMTIDVTAEEMIEERWTTVGMETEVGIVEGVTGKLI